MKALKKLLRAIPVLAAVLGTLALAVSPEAGFASHHHHVPPAPYIGVVGSMFALELLILWATRSRGGNRQNQGQRQPSQQAAWPGYGYPQPRPATRRGR